MIKNKIITTYPKSVFETKKSKVFYIADFTKRTKKISKVQQRGVEFLDNQPFDPNEPTKEMPCLIIENPKRISVECNIFDDCQFVDNYNNQLKHGECCFFPSKNDGRSWFSIVEIKDCISGKISEYKKDIQAKMDSMFNIFRNKVSIPNKFYFIVSFPRKKTAFNDALFSDYVALKKYKKAFLIVSNFARIMDTHEIEFEK